MMTLPEQVHTALDRLKAAGWEAFVVGGAVRDALRGCAAGDWDITTDAEPEQVEQVFSGERLIATGLRHGTVTVLLDGLPLEITTYRVDGGYSDHRRPDSVTFTRSLRDDLLHAQHVRTRCVHALGADVLQVTNDLLFLAVGADEHGLPRLCLVGRRDEAHAKVFDLAHDARVVHDAAEHRAAARFCRFARKVDRALHAIAEACGLS